MSIIAPAAADRKPSPAALARRPFGAGLDAALDRYDAARAARGLPTTAERADAELAARPPYTDADDWTDYGASFGLTDAPDADALDDYRAGRTMAASEFHAQLEHAAEES